MSRFLLIIIFFGNFNNTFGAEGKGGMPQLNPESFSSQLFWLLIFFLFLYIVVNKIFIPKIKKVREDRNETIEKLISDSKSINESVDGIIKKINDDMNKEKENANNKINKAINENKEILEKKISALDDDLEKKRNAIQKDFDNSKTLTEKKIPEIIISLSDQIFEKILGEKKKSNLSEFKKFTESSK